MSKTQHPITDELLDQLLANYQNPEDLIGADGILKQLTKKLVERALDAEVRMVNVSSFGRFMRQSSMVALRMYCVSQTQNSLA